MISKVINDKNIEKLQRLRQMSILEKDKEALIFLLKEPLGRWFLSRLFDRCKILNPSVSDNAERTFYNEGMRCIGLLYFNEIKQLGMEGILWKQAAEREYADIMVNIEQLITELIEEQEEDE